MHWFALGFSILGAVSPASAHDRSWPGRRLAEALPEAASYTARPVALTPDQIGWAEKALGSPLRTEDRTPTFYVGVDGAGASVGVVVFLDADGVNGKVEMADALAPDGKLLHVVLYDHAEPAAVGKPEFLKQFAAKSGADHFMVGMDVTSPAGAEKSAQAIATAARRGVLMAMAGLGLGTTGGAK